MQRMNRWRAPRWVRIWTITVTRLGDGWIWYALGFLLLGFGGPQRFAAVSAAGAAAVFGVFVFKALKHLSQRPRPCQIEPHCWSKVLPPDQFSFPSGHTMTAFPSRWSSVIFILHLKAFCCSWSWHALPQRRSRRNGFGRSVRLRFDYRFRLDGPRLELCSPFTSKLAAWCDLTARRGMPRDYFYQ